MKCKYQKIIETTSIKNIITYVAYAILCFIPIARLGISCGDDLYWKQATEGGLIVLAKSLWTEVVYQGRVLGILQFPSLMLSFFDNIILFKISKILFIILDYILVSILLEKMVDKTSAVINMILFPLFIQIAFQNSPPECYTIFILLPFAYFLVSCLLFDSWLVSGGRLKLLFSGILLFVTLSCYELYILYCPLYFLIALKRESCKNNLKKSIVNIVKKIWVYVVVTLIYLVMYFVFRLIFPSNYNGVKIQISSIRGCMNILKMLVLSGIPGMYQADPQVKYLIDISRGEYLKIEDKIQSIIDLRLIGILILFVVLILGAYRKRDTNKIKKCNYIATILCSFYFIIFPPILNAVSVSWQVYADNTNRIIGSTVSYLIELALVCAISILISWIIKYEKKKVLFFVVFILEILGGYVQAGNNDLSNLQKVCYERVENTEDILTQPIIERFSVDTIYAPEIYKPSLMIGIRDDQWIQYANYHKLPIEIDKNYKGQNWYLSCNNKGKVFWLSRMTHYENEVNVHGNNIIILSKEKLTGKTCFFRTYDDDQKFIEIELAGQDSIMDFWVYTYSFDKEIYLDNIFLVN